MRSAFRSWGFLANAHLPDWALRHLRYTAVAILPALVAPMVVFPSGGEVDPWRIAAALATLAVGYVTRNVLLGILAGAGTLWGIPALLSLV